MAEQTNAKEGHGLPGDLMPFHAMGLEFVKLFGVECKHYKDLELGAYIYDASNKSFMGKVYEQHERQCKKAGVVPMIIARQNRRPTLLIVPGYLTPAVLEAAGPEFVYIQWHRLHKGNVFLAEFKHITDYVRPTKFLKLVEDLTR